MLVCMYKVIIFGFDRGYPGLQINIQDVLA